jgi:hypothetical protein
VDEVAASLRRRGITGYPGHCQTCPIAVLILREFPDSITAKEMAVTSRGVLISGPPGDGYVRLPAPVTGFIRAFDQRRYPDMIRTEMLAR